MTAQDVVMVAALVLFAIGVLRDTIQSDREKGPGGGLLGGTFRPWSWSGFLSGLPWYLSAGLLFALAAWGSW